MPTLAIYESARQGIDSTHLHLGCYQIPQQKQKTIARVWGICWWVRNLGLAYLGPETAPAVPQVLKTNGLINMWDVEQVDVLAVTSADRTRKHWLKAVIKITFFLEPVLQPLFHALPFESVAMDQTCLCTSDESGATTVLGGVKGAMCLMRFCAQHHQLVQFVSIGARRCS
eukprot:1155323-Pelagomonas_calceolata.AAC.2